MSRPRRKSSLPRARPGWTRELDRGDRRGRARFRPRFAIRLEEDKGIEYHVNWLRQALHDRAMLLVVDNVDLNTTNLEHIPFPGADAVLF